jgi:hypothetical protein
VKVAFYASDKPREIMLAKAFELGIRQLGDEFELRRTADYGEERKYEGPSPETDIAICFGVKGRSAEIIKEHVALGKHAVYLDKGYTRQKGEGGHTLYTRLSIDSSSPVRYFQRVRHSNDRFNRLEMPIRERKRTTDGHILFCGSSQKYHDFNGLGDATEYSAKALFKLRKASGRQIVYRPKPSAKDLKPIANYMFSSGSQDITDALRGCHAVVTHGSSVAIYAVLAGIPIVVLGETVMSPVAESDIVKVDEPFWPKSDRRFQWACDFAHCQWTQDEMKSGEAWQYVREEIAHL